MRFERNFALRFVQVGQCERVGTLQALPNLYSAQSTIPFVRLSDPAETGAMKLSSRPAILWYLIAGDYRSSKRRTIVFDQYLLEDLNSLKQVANAYLGTLPLLTAVFEMCLLQQACIGQSMAAQIVELQEWLYMRCATAVIQEAA